MLKINQVNQNIMSQRVKNEINKLKENKDKCLYPF